MARARIGELLVEAKVITQAQLDDALGSPRGAGQKLGAFLVEQGVVTEAQLTQTLSLQLSVPWVSLYHIDFPRQLLALVPREVAERFCAIPIFLRTEKKKASTLYVAMDDPTNELALTELSTAAGGLPVKPMIASPSDIRSAIRVYYSDPSESPPTTREPVSARVPVPPQAPEGPPPPPPPPPPAPFPAGANPAAPARPPPPPPAGRPPLATVVDSMEILSTEPVSRSAEDDSPDAAPELEVSDYVPRPRQASGPRMVALTLLDGTTLNLPARQSQPPATPKADGSTPPSPSGHPSLADTLTARDLVSALRAVHHGADASEILGETDWQALVAALLSLLLKKNLIADWEFIDELRNI